MPDPSSELPYREDWDENDWERFLQRADVRTAKYQELFETLLDHPERDRLIAREMGWADDHNSSGCDDKECRECDERFDCEAYELLRLANDPESIGDDPEADDIIASFDEVRRIPAYGAANEFASRLQERLRAKMPGWDDDEDAAEALINAHMVAARIAGGHGIGYDRDSLCGNIANGKRGRRNLEICVEHIRHLEARRVLDASVARDMVGDSRKVAAALENWIEQLRARIWWQ